MEFLTRVVGHAASAATLLLFSGGLMVCRRIQQKGTSKDVPLLPFAVGSFFTFVMLIYSYEIGNPNLLRTFALAAPLQIFNVLVHQIYAERTPPSKDWQTLSLLGLMMGGIWFCKPYMAVETLGLIGSTGKVFRLLSLLPAVPKVIREKDSSCLPFPIVVLAFLVSSLWTTHRALLGKMNFPDGDVLGVCITSFLLILCIMFPGGRSTKMHTQ